MQSKTFPCYWEHVLSFSYLIENLYSSIIYPDFRFLLAATLLFLSHPTIIFAISSPNFHPLVKYDLFTYLLLFFACFPEALFHVTFTLLNPLSLSFSSSIFICSHNGFFPINFKYVLTLINNLSCFYLILI